MIKHRIQSLGLSLRADVDFELVNPQSDPRYRDYWETYHRLMERRGITPDLARTIIRTNTTVIAGIMVHRNEADSLICGTFGQYLWHLSHVSDILARDGLSPVGGLSLMLDETALFIADTHVNAEPTSEQIAEIAIGAARHARRFGVTPRVALCSHSQFGNLNSASGLRMRGAIEILDEMNVDFAYEGEMHSDAALDPELRDRIFPNSRLVGPANVLVFSNVDAASGVRNVLKSVSGSLEVGPILMGMGNKAFIATPSITSRGLLNMTALAGTSVKIYA